MRSVSTWSLHRTLGRYIAQESTALGGPFMTPPAVPGGMALLDLPRELKAHGFDAVQICHFHLPTRSPEYLAQLRGALDDAGITLEALLIDDGDFTDAAHADQVEAWVNDWLTDAATLGALRTRVMVGRLAPTPALVQASAERLTRLAQAHPDVRIVIENWSGMLHDAESVLALLHATDGAVGLLFDLGNWSGPDKYAELARIAPFAETCHAKCHFKDGVMNTDDYRRSLQVLKDAGYQGPLALIYDGPDADEWAWLAKEDEIVRSIFS